MTRIDHTNCTHPRTAAGRKACRKGNAAPVVTVTPIIASPEDTIALLHLAAQGHDAAPLLETIDTEEGPIRVGSVVWIMFRGDREALKCTITDVSDDIKNGRPGVEAIDSDGNERWAYAHQVAQIVTF